MFYNFIDYLIDKNYFKPFCFKKKKHNTIFMKISILTVDNHPFAGLVKEIRKKFNIFNVILDKKDFQIKILEFGTKEH